MRVILAVLADAANLSADGKLNILGVFDTIFAQGFPAVHNQMFLVLRFEADPFEGGEKKKIELRLFDSLGNKMFGLDGETTLPERRTVGAVHMNQILSLNNVKFDRAGEYRFEIAIEGTVAAELPLRVAGASPSRQNLTN